MASLAGDAPLFAGLASAAVPLIAGWPLSGLLPRTLRRSIVSRLAMAWLLGAAWCGTAALAASRAGGLPLRRTTLLPIVLLPLIVAAVVLRRSLPIGPMRRATAAGIGAGAIAGISGAVLLVGALTTPVLDWDGRMTWSPQARLIRMERTATPASFTDPWVWTSHPQYPPLVALVQATGLELVDAPRDERAGRGVHPLFFLALLAVLYRSVGILSRSVPAAAAATSLAAMTPFLAFESHGGAAGAYSDVPLGAFLGAGLAVLLCGRAGARTGAVAGLLLAGAVLTKNEGLPLVAALLLVTLVVALGSLWRRAGARGPRVRRLLRGVVPLADLVACSALLLGAYRSVIPNRYDEDYASIVRHGDFTPSVLAGKAATVLPHLAAKLGTFRTWGLLFPLLGLLALVRPRVLRSRASLAAIGFLLAPIGLGFVAYLVHWDPVYLADTTFDRFLVQGSFGTFLLLGLLAAKVVRPVPAGRD